jgi:hypothetical protein
MIVYVTYGIGTNLNGCYSKVEGADYEECRAKIFQGTKARHAFDYDETEGLRIVEKYSLREVPLQPHKEVKPENEDDELFF